MLKLSSHLIARFSTLTANKINIPPSVADLSNSIGYLNSTSTPTMTISEKLNLYNSIDLFSRDALFSLANDYQLGLPLAVVAMSVILRGAFFYTNIKAQINGLKLAPYMKQHMQKMEQVQSMGGIANPHAAHIMNSMKTDMANYKKLNNIKNIYNVLNLIQLPLLITWFLSLRHIASSPLDFPSVTQSWYWIPDISQHDPYFILPIASAVLTSCSIMISPGLKPENVLPPLKPIVKFMKYLPLISLVTVGFFPAILHMCWSTFAIYQLVLMGTMNTSWVKNHYANVKMVEKTNLIKEERLKELNEESLREEEENEKEGKK